jgi:hypothetical protein
MQHNKAIVKQLPDASTQQSAFKPKFNLYIEGGVVASHNSFNDNNSAKRPCVERIYRGSKSLPRASVSWSGNTVPNPATIKHHISLASKNMDFEFTFSIHKTVIYSKPMSEQKYWRTILEEIIDT